MKKRIWKRLFIALLCLALIGGVTVLGINGHVKKSTADQILSPEEAATLTDVDCILGRKIISMVTVGDDI